jgi:hypothetical protein
MPRRTSWAHDHRHCVAETALLGCCSCKYDWATTHAPGSVEPAVPFVTESRSEARHAGLQASKMDPNEVLEGRRSSSRVDRASFSEALQDVLWDALRDDVLVVHWFSTQFGPSSDVGVELALTRLLVRLGLPNPSLNSSQSWSCPSHRS